MIKKFLDKLIQEKYLEHAVQLETKFETYCANVNAQVQTFIKEFNAKQQVHTKGIEDHNKQIDQGLSTLTTLVEYLIKSKSNDTRRD